MSLNIWNLEWLNHNAQRSYPITEWATKECTESSDVLLPDDFILALSLSIQGCHSLDIDSFYIKSILVMETGCTIIIGYNGNDVAVTHILANQEQSTYALTGLGSFSDVRGYIAVNPDSKIMKGFSGYYNFTKEATQLEPDCIRPMIKSISSITVYSDDFSNAQVMYGDVVFRAGANMDIRISTDGDNHGLLMFSAIDGSGLNEECPCDIENKERPTLRSINGVIPDENGNINLIGSNCLSITSDSNGITLTDTCAEPCCGCAELDALYDNVKDFKDGATTLRNAIENLTTRQQQVEMVYQSEGKSSCNCKSNS